MQSSPHQRHALLPIPAASVAGQWKPRPFIVSVLIIATAALSGSWLAQRPSDPVQELVALTHQLPRSSPARVPRFPYAPYVGVDRGAIGTHQHPDLVVELARLEREAAHEPTVDSLQALGVGRLVLGAFDQAIDVLQRARRLPGGSRVDDDLSTALLARGLRQADVRSIAEALELLDRPVGARRSAASRFNEALALEAIGLSDQAVTAWKAYLAADPSSGWADEARRHLEKETRNDLASAEAIERSVLETLLPQWAEAALAGKPVDGEKALVSATQTAALHEHHYGDSLLSSILHDARVATGDRQRALGRAHLAYGGARAAYRAQNLPRCRADAALAGEALDGIDSQLLPLAVLAEASCSYLAGEFVESERLLKRAASTSPNQPRRSRLLEAQINWMRGLVAHALGKPLGASQFYAWALDGFAQAGDRPREARVHSLLADLDEYLGREDAAWAQTRFALMGRLAPGRQYPALCTLIRLAVGAGLPSVARRATASAALEASRSGVPEFVADTEMMRAKALASAGDHAGAVASLRQALRLASAIPQPDRARRMLGYARVELAELLAGDDLTEADRLVDEASLAGTGELEITAAMLRAESAQRRGLFDLAERTLRTAISRSARERRSFADLRDRDRFFTRREAIHTQLIRLLVDRGRPVEALDVLEGWRDERPVIAGAFEGDTNGPPLSSALRADPHRGFYSVLSLPDELLVWRATADGLALARHRISRPELLRLVDQAAREVRQNASSDAGSRLARLIFEEKPRTEVTRLVIAADPVVIAAPFAALPEPAGDGTLLDRYEIDITPGLAAWLRRDKLPAASGCTLVIEGAADGGPLFPELPHLGRLHEEARTVAEEYRCVRLGRGLGEVRKELAERRPAILHYAGHAIGWSPGGPALLFDGDGPVAPVELAEIESWNLRGSTVVLSACAGASGRPSALAGRDGLARAFLSAGARSVVANLWPVADESAFELARELHARLGRNEPIGHALRETQRALATRGLPPNDWAGWILIGAG